MEQYINLSITFDGDKARVKVLAHANLLVTLGMISRLKKELAEMEKEAQLELNDE
jgi:hypothetical protein